VWMLIVLSGSDRAVDGLRASVCVAADLVGVERRVSQAGFDGDL